MYDDSTALQLKIAKSEADDDILFFAIWRIVQNRPEDWVKVAYLKMTGTQYADNGLNEKQAKEDIVSFIQRNGDVKRVMLDESDDWISDKYQDLTKGSRKAPASIEAKNAYISGIIEDRCIDISLLFLHRGTTILSHGEKVSGVIEAMKMPKFNGTY